MFNNLYHHEPYVIFISGASGAGKTTLLKALSADLRNSSIAILA